MREIDIRRYGNDIRILSTNNNVDVYRYSDAMLKYMLDDALKTYEETLHSIKVVIPANNFDGRPNNNDNSRADVNLKDRIDKFHNLLGKKKIYRIPLRFLIELSLVNFPRTLDRRHIFTLKRDLNRLFESKKKKKKVNPIPDPDAKTIIFQAPFISYPEIKLNEDFEVHISTQS